MSYVRFIATLVVSLMVMFILSLEQVRSLDHFYLNASNFYISLTMVGAMGLIMLGAMWRMFKDRQKKLLMAGALPSSWWEGSHWLGPRHSSVTRAFSSP